MSTQLTHPQQKYSVVPSRKYVSYSQKSLLTRSQFEGELKEKTKVISDLKVKEGKDIDKMIEMDKQIKFLNEVLYKRNQSIQTIHMLAPKCALSWYDQLLLIPKYLKMAQSDKPSFLSKQTESVNKEVHNNLLKSFAKLEKHSISLELSLQHCKEQMKNNPVCKENASNVFRKEREQYHEIQDLKAQMQDKNMVINELKKLILVTKGKSVETQFDKPSVVRQPNAQRIPKPSVLGKPTPFSNSPEMRSFQTKQSVNKTNVSDGLFKQVTQQNCSKRNQAIVQLILFIVDSGCTKHMTGNLKLLCNFMEKFLGTVCFGNEQSMTFGQNSSSLGLHVKRRLNKSVQASVINAPFLNDQMMSDHNSSDLAPQRQEMSVENVSSGLVPQGQKASDYDNSDPMPPDKIVYLHKNTRFARQGRGIDLKNHWLQLLALEAVRIFVAHAHTRRVGGNGSARGGWEMKFFLGLQIHQSLKGIFINQAKYALEILKKHNMENCHSIGTPLATKPKLDVDLSGEPVDQSDLS
ncbi:retrovirus-related pol polyprotein from transposon TNT 1-94 [Tanacetum coccineum]